LFFRKKNISSALTDEELITQFKQSGEMACIGHLFNRYTEMAFWVCLKYLKNEEESRDTVMQVFERLVKDLERYEIKLFRPWFHTILKNECYHILQKRQKNLHTHIPIEDISETDLTEDTEEAEWRLHYLQRLPEILATLNIPQRNCIELFYLQNKSYQEVMEITGYDLKQVKSYIQNGKRNLKIRLEENTHLQE
jgi:RNA polymerase sigma-70 factor (ECF subfamily)